MKGNVPPPNSGPQKDVYGSWADPVAPAAGLSAAPSRGAGAVPIYPTAVPTVASSFDMNLHSASAMLKETQNVLSQIVVTAQSTAQFMRDAAASAKDAASAWSDVKAGRVTDFGGRGGAVPVAAGHGGGVTMTSEGVSSANRSSTWYASAADARGETPRGLITKAAASASRKLSEGLPGSNAPQVQPAPGGGYTDTSTGQPMTQVQQAGAAGGGVFRRILGHVTRGLHGEGGGILGSMASAGGGLGMAAKIGIGAAAGVSVGEQLYGRLRGQFMANTPYRQILGVGQAGAFEERANQAGFQLQNYLDPTGLSGADASKLYTGLLSIGYRGDDGRGLATDFGVNNFKKYGMGVDDSLRLIQESFRAGHTELMGLSTALDAVAKSAKASKVAIVDAQQSFSQSYAATNQLLGPAQTAAATKTSPMMAAAFTNFQTNLGPQYKNVNIAQALAGDYNNQALLASMSGIPGVSSPEQFFAYANSSNAHAATATAAIGNFLGRMTSGAFAGTDIQQKWEQFKSRHGIKAQATNDQIDTFLREHALDPSMAFVGRKAKAYLDQQGYKNLTEEQATGLAFRFQFAGAQLGDEAAAQVTALNPRLTGSASNRVKQLQDLASKADVKINLHVPTRADYNRARVAGHGRGGGNPYAATHSYGAFKQHEIAQQLGQLHEGNALGGQSSGDLKQNAQQEYLKRVQETGVGSEIVQNLINMGKTDLQLRVQTAKGSYAVVYLTEAIRDFYDQLVDGSAMIVNGSHAGSRVDEATDLQGTGLSASKAGLKSTKNSPALANQLSQASKLGVDLKIKGGSAIHAWTGSDTRALKSASRNAGTGGVLRIEATPQLQQLFKFAMLSNPETSSQQSGTVPVSNPTAPDLGGSRVP